MSRQAPSAQSQSGYTERLDDDLALRTAAHEDDVERIAVFNAAIHGAELAPMTRSLLRGYPGMEPADQVYVENADGEIVSALCLIPWTWNYEGVRLRAGEMGIVGTLDGYRGRGLIRAQVDYFKRRLRERRCVLSHIQGIAYFYRQFDYQYALPLEGGYRWEFRHMPAAPGSERVVRRGSVDDIPALASMYDATVRGLCIHTERSADVWRYLISRDDPADAMVHDTWIIEENGSAGAAALGYVRIPHFHFGEELVIDEAYAARHDVALDLLSHARSLAQERNKPGMRLNLPASSIFVRLALAHGATALGTYAWQIHAPDDAALLQALAPAFGGAARSVALCRLDRPAAHELLSASVATDIQRRFAADGARESAARRGRNPPALRCLRPPRVWPPQLR